MAQVTPLSRMTSTLSTRYCSSRRRTVAAADARAGLPPTSSSRSYRPRAAIAPSETTPARLNRSRRVKSELLSSISLLAGELSVVRAESKTGKDPSPPAGPGSSGMDSGRLSLAVHGEIVHGGRRHAVRIHRLVHGHVQDVVVEARLADQLEVVSVGVHRRERRTRVPFLVFGRRVRVLEAGQDARAAELAVQMILDAVASGAVGGRGDHDVDVAAEVDDVAGGARIDLHLRRNVECHIDDIRRRCWPLASRHG